MGATGFLGDLMGASMGGDADVAKTMATLAAKLMAKLKDPATVGMVCRTLKSVSPAMIMALLAAINVPDAERRSKYVQK